MKSRWITHAGKSIFHIDLSDFWTDVDALKAELDEASAITCQQPENSLLVLTDVRGTVLSTEVLNIGKESSARTTKHVHKTAVLGISGFRKVLLDAVSRFSGQCFAVFEEAKDWLVSG
jgi:hypothetical protein